MATLLLQCVAPLQSWGIQSQFTYRDTGREPSKSGIVGLLCAALGRPRYDTETIARLAALKMGVRVDREGKILRDYHTAGLGGYYRASGGIERKKLITSDRYYLSDAAFLVALQGEKKVLETLHAALANPCWMLFLGRKSCPPSPPVYIPANEWDWDHKIDKVFEIYPWLGKNEAEYKQLDRVRLVLDDDNGHQIHHDHPISFEKGKRQFAPRRVRTTFIDKPPFQNGEDPVSASPEV